MGCWVFTGYSPAFCHGSKGFSDPISHTTKNHTLHILLAAFNHGFVCFKLLFTCCTLLLPSDTCFKLIKSPYYVNNTETFFFLGKGRWITDEACVWHEGISYLEWLSISERQHHWTKQCFSGDDQSNGSAAFKPQTRTCSPSIWTRTIILLI